MISRRYLRCILLLVTVLFLPELKSSAAEDLVQGARLYQLHCAGCQGAKGEGG